MRHQILHPRYWRDISDYIPDIGATLDITSQILARHQRLYRRYWHDITRSYWRDIRDYIPDIGSASEILSQVDQLKGGGLLVLTMLKMVQSVT